jgi:hypothetical protein
MSNKPNVVKIIFKTTLPKYSDLYLFEPHMITNNDEVGKKDNLYNRYDEYYSNFGDSLTSSEKKIMDMLKCFVFVPYNIKLTKEIVNIDDSSFGITSEKKDRKKIFSYFLNQELFDKTISKFQKKFAMFASTSSSTKKVDVDKIVLDNIKILLKYLLFPTGSVMYLEGKKFKVHGFEIQKYRIHYPIVNPFKSIQGYEEENILYDAQILDQDTTYNDDEYDDKHIEDNLDEFDAYKQEYEAIQKDIKDQVGEDYRYKRYDFSRHEKKEEKSDDVGETENPIPVDDTDEEKNEEQTDLSKSSVTLKRRNRNMKTRQVKFFGGRKFKRKLKKNKKNKRSFNYRGGAGETGTTSSSTTEKVKKTKTKRVLPPRKKLKYNQLDYNHQKRVRVMYENGIVVRKIMQVRCIHQVVVVLNLFEISNEKMESGKGFNCDYHAFMFDNLLNELIPKEEDEIIQTRKRIKRLKFVKFEEPVNEEEIKKENEKLK